MKSVSAAYIAAEASATRRPAELYHIWKEGGDHWYYTSGDAAVSYGGQTYAPAPIARGTAGYDTNLETSTLTVTTGYLESPAIQFISLYPIDVYWISVMKIHRDMSPIEASVVFVGQIKNVSFKGREASIECVGLEYFLKQPIPRFRYQVGCNNSLYDTRCAVDSDSYKVTTTVTVSADGLTLTSADFSGYDDGYFTRGYMEKSGSKAMIVYHAGTAVTLRYPVYGLATGDSVDVYPGCDLRIETCRDKFDNVLNFFGMPYIPLENPTVRV
ncbi:MAG: DUF2163 domain-containing protein [Proteobacteria bacterium]|nr:DUF2163 domain-containing protein [Pseudomonadota bacterium]